MLTFDGGASVVAGLILGEENRTSGFLAVSLKHLVPSFGTGSHRLIRFHKHWMRSARIVGTVIEDDYTRPIVTPVGLF